MIEKRRGNTPQGGALAAVRVKGYFGQYLDEYWSKKKKKKAFERRKKFRQKVPLEFFVYLQPFLRYRSLKVGVVFIDFFQILKQVYFENFKFDINK